MSSESLNAKSWYDRALATVIKLEEGAQRRRRDAARRAGASGSTPRIFADGPGRGGRAIGVRVDGASIPSSPTPGLPQLTPPSIAEVDPRNGRTGRRPLQVEVRRRRYPFNPGPGELNARAGVRLVTTGGGGPPPPPPPPPPAGVSVQWSNSGMPTVEPR